MRNSTRNLIRAGNWSGEVHATIRLPKGKRINVQKTLDSLLDALEGGIEQVDAIFIRFVRTTEKG